MKSITLIEFAQTALGVIKWAKDHGADKAAMNTLLKMGKQVIKEPMTVFVLSFDTDAGLGAYVYKTREAADLGLFEYVEECWKAEMGDAPMPANHTEAIEQYFESVENERATVEELEIQD